GQAASVAGTVGQAASVAGTVGAAAVVLGTVGQAASVKTTVVAGTVADKLNYELKGTQSFNNTGQTANLPANVKAVEDTTLSGTAIGDNFASFFANAGTVTSKVVQ